LACSLPRFHHAQFIAFTIHWQEYNALKRSLKIKHNVMNPAHVTNTH